MPVIAAGRKQTFRPLFPCAKAGYHRFNPRSHLAGVLFAGLHLKNLETRIKKE